MPNHAIDHTLATSLGAIERAYEAGEKVFLEADTGTEMFVVTSGRIDVITYGTVLDNVRTGGIFGEMALIDDGQRSAAAIAAEPSTVIAISKPTFLAMLQHQPEFALRVMRALSERLRKMNRQL